MTSESQAPCAMVALEESRRDSSNATMAHKYKKLPDTFAAKFMHSLIAVHNKPFQNELSSALSRGFSSLMCCLERLS